MMSKRYYIIAAALLLAAAVTTGCGGKDKDAAAARDKAADKPVPVEVVAIKTQAVQRTVGFVGTLKAYEEAAVSSTLETPVKAVYVDMGSRVRQGQVLVKLDDERYRIKVAMADAALKNALAKIGVDDESKLVVDNVSYVRKAKAELADTERNLNRMKELFAKGYIARSQLDEAQARYDVSNATLSSQNEFGMSLYSEVKAARANLELAKKELRDTEVRAPFSGMVSARLVDPGNFAKVGSVLVNLVRVDPVRLRGEIPEVNSQDVRQGQAVEVRLTAAPDKVFTGKIDRISPSSSPESRAFSVEVEIPNGSGLLKPGYFAEASIKTRMDEGAMVVPLNSVINFAGITKIFVVQGGKAVEKQVTPGVRAGEVVEVSGDVKPGDTVVTTGMKRLYNGKTVSVRK